MAACEVLVEHNNRKQIVKFIHSDEIRDVKQLTEEVVKVFKIEGAFVIQMKREEWGGEFVDVMNNDSIAEHSVMRVVRVEDESIATLDVVNKVCAGRYGVAILYFYMHYRLVYVQL